MQIKNNVEDFISRWQGSTASELATAQSFLIDLYELLGVDKPHATADQDYMFERPLKEAHGDGGQSDRRVDCYKRGHFILEAKKIKAMADILTNAPTPLDLDAIAAHFKARGRWRERLPTILETLVAIGRVRSVENTSWSGV